MAVLIAQQPAGARLDTGQRDAAGNPKSDEFRNPKIRALAIPDPIQAVFASSFDSRFAGS
jgi:hypothetical protein